jgi:23S rRNA pseudouridine1911/1915/1917 synthase
MNGERVLEVRESDAHVRLDAFLARELELSRAYARRLLARGSVRRERASAAKGASVVPGERIRVGSFRHPREGPLGAPELPLAIVAEHRGWVAVDKPAGMPSHPLDFDERHTAVNAFLARFPETTGVGGEPLQCALVNRLDTLTSGVLLFATDADAWTRARSAFRDGRVEKRYLARVHGRIAGELDLDLRLAHRGERMRVVANGGLAARARARALTQDADTTLLEIDLYTGVRHQIRASLAHFGHPIVGDGVYGSPLALPRHWLHAFRLRIDGFEAQALPPAELAPPRDP